jgi:hypothetical protein
MNLMSSQTGISWVSLWGTFDVTDEEVTFRGYLFPPSQPVQLTGLRPYPILQPGFKKIDQKEHQIDGGHLPGR